MKYQKKRYLNTSYHTPKDLALASLTPLFIIQTSSCDTAELRVVLKDKIVIELDDEIRELLERYSNTEINNNSKPSS
jgi:hypothetical protein